MHLLILFVTYVSCLNTTRTTHTLFPISSLSTHSYSKLSDILKHIPSQENRTLNATTQFSNYYYDDSDSTLRNFCLNGSTGLVVLGLAFTVSIYLFMHYIWYAAICGFCIHMDEDQNPTSYLQLLWLDEACFLFQRFDPSTLVK